jgi:type I restriction enzyme M protein
MTPSLQTEGGFLGQAVELGYATTAEVRSRTQITYLATNRSEYLTDPASQVRAEFWAELILQYGYEPERIAFDVPVPGGSARQVADLVVFKDQRRTKPFAVIECKAKDINDAEFAQAIEQAVGNGSWTNLQAAYIGVVAGSTRRFLDFTGEYGILEREQNIIADFPAEYGKPAEFKYRRGCDPDISPVPKESLIAALRRSHQTLWGGGRLSPPAAFGELCKLLFVKIHDERSRRKKGEPYEFQIRTHETPQQLGLRIRTLYSEGQKRDPTVFSEEIKVPDGALRSIVAHLEAINLSKTDLDVKGVAFETFMDSFFKGDFGQFFTPREVVKFIVELLEPTEDDLVLDPACGSGGFLLEALDFVQRRSGPLDARDSKEKDKDWLRFAEKQIFGIEINDEITRVAKMNMILHDDGHSNIVGADALEGFGQLESLNRRLRPKHFDLVITNPPFGAQVLASERSYLSGYELAFSRGKGESKSARKGQKTEILFIERIWQFLKPGGRMAVILPDGILTNPSLQYVRDFIVERFRLMAIVSLPSTAFTHYGAGVKASVIFAQRRKSGDEPSDDETVFMAEAAQIGYDAAGRDANNELPEILEAYRQFVIQPAKFEA